MTPAKITARAREIVADHLQVDPALVTADATFDSLGADSLDFVEISMLLEEEFDLEINDDEAVQNDTFGKAVDWLVRRLGVADDDDVETCIACEVAFKEGDRVLSDVSGGALHAACCGPERESYTNGDGGPLGPDDPIPEGYIWTKWPKRAVAA